ncbi:glycoside hydrolase family protein [Jatrophihabitans fulvus]
MNPTALLDVIADADATVVIDPPGEGVGFWAGGPSAVWQDGSFHLAYRLRRPVTEGRGYANVIARSDDGERFETVATVTAEQFACASLERPALVPLDTGWRLYVSCSTESSKHWWVEAIEADTLEGLPDGRRTVVLPGDDATAWKDVVVRRAGAGWQMWACRHPLDGGDDEADRMTSVHLTSDDGLAWTERATALRPTEGSWDARGTRITSVVRSGAEWVAFYDGRASAAENWFERTGVAVGDGPDAFTAVAGPTPSGRTVRYVSLAETPLGTRFYWEASRSDGANDLRTAYVPRPESPSQS